MEDDRPGLLRELRGTASVASFFLDLEQSSPHLMMNRNTCQIISIVILELKRSHS